MRGGQAVKLLFFIDRPIFAGVLSIFILAGLVSYLHPPLASTPRWCRQPSS